MISINVKRIISKFALEVSQTPQESAFILVDELLDNLKLFNIKKTFKISSNILHLKDKLIKIKIEEASDLIENFNSIISTFFEDYKEQYKKWNRPKTIDFKNILVQEIQKSRKNLNKKLFGVSVNATAILKDIQLLELKYSFKQTIQNKIKVLKNRLKKITKISYQEVIEIIKSGKLLNF